MREISYTLMGESMLPHCNCGGHSEICPHQYRINREIMIYCPDCGDFAPDGTGHRVLGIGCTVESAIADFRESLEENPWED